MPSTKWRVVDRWRLSLTSNITATSSSTSPLYVSRFTNYHRRKSYRAATGETRSVIIAIAIKKKPGVIASGSILDKLCKQNAPNARADFSERDKLSFTGSARGSRESFAGFFRLRRSFSVTAEFDASIARAGWSLYNLTYLRAGHLVLWDRHVVCWCACYDEEKLRSW